MIIYINYSNETAAHLFVCIQTMNLFCIWLLNISIIAYVIEKLNVALSKAKTLSHNTHIERKFLFFFASQIIVRKSKFLRTVAVFLQFDFVGQE